MTMCVRGKCGKPAPKTALSSSTERVVSESHRVDEIKSFGEILVYRGRRALAPQTPCFLGCLGGEACH